MSDTLKGLLIGGLFSLLTPILMFWLDIRFNRPKEKDTLSSAILKSAQALDITSDQLIEAFQEVKKLRAELDETKLALDAEREARHTENKKFAKDMRRWTLYAAQLSKQVIEKGGTPVPFPPDSDPKIEGLG